MYEYTANVGFLNAVYRYDGEGKGTSNLCESKEAVERCRSLMPCECRVINEKAKKGR